MNRENMNSETDDILSYTPSGLPIWPISGSEGETDGADDDNDPDDDEPDEADGEQQEAAEDKRTPEQLREELQKTKAALKKAQGEAKKRRLAAKGAEKDGDDAATKAAQAAEQTWRPRLVKAEARAALVAAGAQSDRVAKLLRLVDMEEVEVNEDGEVEGLEDQIEEIKGDYPELFAAKHDASSHGRRVARVNGASQERQRKELTPTQRQVALLQGGR